ncbi:hypothetical protein AC1031_020878 [Aphanomyces cochlioides]|nr:hypothetical protein AC1031_020878 [Aphanomyces cochlioides]
MSILERIPSELRSRRRVFLTLESGRAYFRRSSILNSMTTLNFQFAATLLDSFLDSALQDDILQFNDVDMDVLDAIVDMSPPLALPIAVEPTMPAMEPRFQQELTTDACVHYDMASIPPLDLLNASFNEDWHLEDQDVALLQGIFDLDASTPVFATMQDPTISPKQGPTRRRKTAKVTTSCSTQRSNASTQANKKYCTEPGCTKVAKSGGKCTKHGNKKICSHAGCEKSVQSRGACKAHGGGSRCQYNGCTKSANLKGLCRGHGGGTHCTIAGCKKWAQRHSLCDKHAKRGAMHDAP